MLKRIIVCFVMMCFYYGAFADQQTSYWYANGNLHETTSCESGDDTSVPNAPHRQGYQFVGWEPAQTYDITTLDASIATSATGNAGDLWFATFNYGKIIGDSLCSDSTQAQFNVGVLNKTPDSGGMCYCHILGFIPNGETNVRSPISEHWVYSANLNSADNCSVYCKTYCPSVYGIQNQTKRQDLYTIPRNF